MKSKEFTIRFKGDDERRFENVKSMLGSAAEYLSRSDIYSLALVALETLLKAENGNVPEKIENSKKEN